MPRRGSWCGRSARCSRSGSRRGPTARSSPPCTGCTAASSSLTPGPTGDSDALDEGEAESVRAVLDYYGDWPAHQLSELTHREAPWRDARAGLAPGERGEREIPQTVLYEFYDGLTTADQ